ncbi:erythrocyte membrane protein 1, PfEMP1, putative [Plasmodium sp. gorilla clade G3]|nr:erythrocyte membrane protein 1, PfEMP1, putative [Plasmodium sp. gorilla clade G3]
METTTSVHDIAKSLQEDAQDSGDIDKLKANPKDGDYTGGGAKGEDFTEICSITTRFSNAKIPHNDPCHGKGNEGTTGTTVPQGESGKQVGGADVEDVAATAPTPRKDTFNRLSIGAKWTQLDGHDNIYLPPRRRDMCTSNLEYLDTTSSGFIDEKATHSLLGDVLLTAYMEGKDIAQHLRSEETYVCPAMKYSFADLGDIIRGKDLWNQNQGMMQVKNKLVTIFGNIKNNLRDIDTSKYDSSDGKYLELRSDWWAANRDKVWEAMTCEAPSGATLFTFNTGGTQEEMSKGKCGHDDTSYTPVDDYIPQQLRWMTEWAENYCRQIEFDYKHMENNYCGTCKNGGKECKRCEKKCNMCAKLCYRYKDFVKEWKPQWKKLQQEYTKLYGDTSTGSDNGDEELKKFFEKLKSATTTGDTAAPYDTLVKYIVSTGGNKPCKDAKQSKFDDNDKRDKEYAFKKYPNEYDSPCKCMDEPCDVAEDAVGNKTTTTCETGDTTTCSSDDKCENTTTCSNDTTCDCNTCEATATCESDATDCICGCKPKISKNYCHKWCCQPSLFKEGESGACMPPRRQNMCIKPLESVTDSSSKHDWRKMVIKSAAIETYLLWLHYKCKCGASGGGSGTDTDTLNSGTIPEPFLRQMFYTYSDYRDICLGNDICKDITVIESNVKNIFGGGSKRSTQNGKQCASSGAISEQSDNKKGKIGSSDDCKNGGNDPEDWWEIVGPDVWKGMLCALSHHISDEDERDKLTEKKEYQYECVSLSEGTVTKLCDFACMPQFLRWMVEWADEFCQIQKKKYEAVKEKCDGCSEEKCDNCNDCKAKCQDYCKYVNCKKQEWEKQENKYKPIYNNKDNAERSTLSPRDKEAAKYIEKLTQDGDTYGNAGMYVKEKGYIQDCNDSQQCNFNNNGNGDNYAFEDYPKEYKQKCTCQKSQDETPSAPPGEDGSPGSEQPKGEEEGSREQEPKEDQDNEKGPSSEKPEEEEDVDQEDGGPPTKDNDSNDQVDGETSPEPAPPGGPSRDNGRSLPPQQPKSNIDVLKYGLSIHVGLLLASIVFYFYLKKKPKKKPSTRPLYRVVYLPEKVSKKYDPHVGKRYIYVEGAGDTTDTTTTSDSDTCSEYEEIYPYISPKYKTLIEVILEPTKRKNTCHTHISHNVLDTVMARDIYTTHTYDTGDIQDTSMYQKDYTKNTSITSDIQDTSMYQKDYTKNTSITHDIPSDIPTNTLVSNMLQRKQIHIPISNISDIRDVHIPDISVDIPNSDIPISNIPIRDVTTNIPMNTYPDIVDVMMDQKPFIRSVRDKDLHGNNDITYNIHWNVPINTFITTTNTVDNPKYVAQKCVSPYSGAPTHIYTGIDLISDTLLVTPCSVTIHSVATHFDTTYDTTCSGVITCNNYDENNRKVHLIHEKYNIMSTNNLYSHSNKICAEHIGSTYKPPNDITTNNLYSYSNIKTPLDLLDKYINPHNDITKNNLYSYSNKIYVEHIG